MNASPRLAFASLLFGFVVSVAACSSSSTPQCVPGASVTCACPGGGTGAQVCSADGTFGACSCAAGAADAGGAAATASDAADQTAVASTHKLDLLVMVDNSPSMTKKQDSLKRSFPALIDALKKLPGGLPDLHLGVVTSDLGAGTIPLPNGGCPQIGGQRGILQSRSAATGMDCGLQGGAVFLTSAQGGTMNNFTGDLAQVFSCLASVGDRGCGYEHQLQATRVALYESMTPQNQGFLRADALLAIVLLTDEDDCSAPPDTQLFVDDKDFPGTNGSFRCAEVGHLCGGAMPPVGAFDTALSTCTPNPAGPLVKVQDIVDSIKQLKQQPEVDIVVAGIYGWPSSPATARYHYGQTPDGLEYSATCQTSYGDSATAGLRVKQFVESFANGQSYSICADDFGPAMDQLAKQLSGRLQ